MKIGILTYYGVHSHGAVLQANALKTVLSDMGHEVCFLTFERNYDYISYNQAKKYKIGLSSIPFYAHYLVQKGPSNIIYNIKKNRVLNTYREQKFQMGGRYNDFDGDVVIVGSDEVFSLEIGLNPCMYGHGIKTPKLISYAACFGPTNLADIKTKKVSSLISSGLQRFDYLSARDENTRRITTELSGKNVELVCDPVILYGYKNEMSIYKPRLDNYILVYSYDRNMNDAEEIKRITDYAKKHNCKTVSIGYPHSWCDMNINADPNELIGYVKNAALVVTDTFHGSVLSIICNKSFVVKLRDNQNKLGFLLEEYGLSNRIIASFQELSEVADKEIDYKTVNTLINKKRQKSLDYLETALN